MTNVDRSTASQNPTDSQTAVRKVTAGLFISLDGVVESPEQWQFDVFDADMARNMAAHIANEDTVLMGRRTYEQWSHFWPNSDLEPYGPHINRTPKIVVSSTLDRVAWGQWDTVSLHEGDLAEEIARLKRQPGKNIGVAGSPTLVASLLRDDLLDELTLMIHPVVVGRGKRLFDDWGDLKRLTLVHSETTDSGVVFAVYQPRRSG